MHILQDLAVNDCDIIPRRMRYFQGERGSHPRTLAICCTKYVRKVSRPVTVEFNHARSEHFGFLVSDNLILHNLCITRTNC